MSRQSSPADTREQAVQAKNAWQQISDKKLGQYTPAELNQLLQIFDATEAKVAEMENLLKKARDEKNEARLALWHLVSNVRTGVAANYGEDSSEYHLFGGTPVHKRRPRRLQSPSQ